MGVLANRFIWFGTTREFDALTQTFIDSDLGAFNAHHYRYAPGAARSSLRRLTTSGNAPALTP
jgi:hypothetical protein